MSYSELVPTSIGNVQVDVDQPSGFMQVVIEMRTNVCMLLHLTNTAKLMFAKKLHS